MSAIQKSEAFETIELSNLALVAGGAGEQSALSRGLSWLGRGARVVSRVALPLRAGLAAYDGVTGFVEARRAGRSVSESFRDAGQNVASGQTFGLIPRPR